MTGQENAINSEELERACYFMEKSGIDFALLTSLENVTYVSGYEVPLHVGPIAAFSTMQPLVLSLINVKERMGCLIAVDAYMDKAKKQSWFKHFASFEAFDSFAAVDSEMSYVGAIRQVIQEMGLVQFKGTLGIEFATLPAIIEKRISFTANDRCCS